MCIRDRDRGFDESVWFPSSHIGSVSDFWGNDYFDDTYWHNGKKQKYKGYCTDIFFNESKRFIEESIEQDKPFFAYIATNTPHGPFYPKDEDYKALMDLYEKSEFADQKELKIQLVKYLAMIRNIDTNIGELNDFLEKKGLLNDTIIIFLTDNGSIMGKSYFNAGMRGMKTELWEGGHRVPLFIKWKKGDLKKAIWDFSSAIRHGSAYSELCLFFRGVALSRKNHYELSSLINLIIAISHSEDHHPEITFGYNTAKVKYFTYAIDGLSENDFICAAKIDKVLEI